MFPKLRTLLILGGDVILLYVALTLTLIIRYGPDNFIDPLQNHLKPFTLIFIVWLVVFYLFDLSRIRIIKSTLVLFSTLSFAVLLSALISVVFFYLFDPFFRLTPKTNLAIFSAIFGLLAFSWRFSLATLIAPRVARIKLLLLGESPLMNEIASQVRGDRHLGYDIVQWLENDIHHMQPERVKRLIADQKITTVLYAPSLMKKPDAANLTYQLLPTGVEITNTHDFAENIFEKAPLDEVEENWFIENVASRHLYDPLKRVIDILLALASIILTSPFMLLSALVVKLTSRGPILYRQDRIGKNGEIFTLYKFRTMANDSEGPLWTVEKDKRITQFGKLLRITHLDEFPQLYNILKGDISFVGPRPERTELANQYAKLPHYAMRHIIKPGLTGWAQINFRPSASLEEAYEKLKYDIYYVKNRSLFLDLIIILKTVRLFFSKAK